MSIQARPPVIAADATSLIVVKAAPGKAVYWGAVGNGTLQPLHTVTDANGVAAAVLTPTGAAGDEITVTATYGD